MWNVPYLLLATAVFIYACNVFSRDKRKGISAGKVIAAAAAAGGWPALLSVSNHHVKEAMMRL